MNLVDGMKKEIWTNKMLIIMSLIFTTAMVTKNIIMVILTFIVLAIAIVFNVDKKRIRHLGDRR